MSNKRLIPMIGHRGHAFYRIIRAIVLVIFVFASPFLSAPTPSFAQNTSEAVPSAQLSTVTISHGPEVKAIERNVDLRNLPTQPTASGIKVIPRPLKSGFPGPKKPVSPSAGPSISAPQPSQSLNMPAPIVSFKGLDSTNLVQGVVPPDPVGDVGPNYYVQAVNVSFGIFNKSGTRLAASTFDALWSGAGIGAPCNNNNSGDVTVVYDPMADRWILGDFAFTGAGTTPPFYECIAVSKTNNPVTGGWWLFPVRADDASHPWFNDYPKMGIWPDGLYMTANMFSGAGVFQEVRVWAFNRADLESGASLHSVIVDLGSTTYFSMLPSNLRGALPPAGRENLMVSKSQTAYAFDVFKFHVDYSGSGSTFTGPTPVSQSSYGTIANTVPTPGNSLDSLADRLMMQAQYRNIGGVKSLWVNHTVQTPSSGPVGIQWAQINVTGGTISTTPVQQQIYGNLGSDGVGRWLGSLAVDDYGDMALGYSAASASVNPDIRYNGRLATDPQNTLPQGETTMLAGVTRATQTGNCGGTCIRWGDYSGMSLDPDGCTFWYTNEYYETNGLNWQTRIGSFKFPSCTSFSLKKSANTASYDHVGQIISYTYVITNGTASTLAGPFSVSDDKLGVINPCGTGPLSPGAHTGCSAPHQITQADLDAGSITNNAIASTMNLSSTLTTPSSSVTVTATQNPALLLAKGASSPTYDYVGQVITYTFTITNAGNVTLLGPFSLSDNKLGTVNSCGSGPVAPNAHTTCKAAHSITQADLDNGSLNNTATASTTYKSALVTSPPANATVTAVQNPHLSLTRHTNVNLFVHVGDVITYTFAATNDGNVTLNTVSISDTLVASLNCTPGQPATLAPGGQLSCTGNYTVKQTDLNSGSISDTANVTGSGPQSQPVSAQVNGSINAATLKILLPVVLKN